MTIIIGHQPSSGAGLNFWISSLSLSWILLLTSNSSSLAAEFSPPLFSPCQFPIPANLQTYKHICRPLKGLKFICDVHRQLDFQDVEPLLNVWKKHESVFRDGDKDLIGIAVVKQLNQPFSSNLLKPNSEEYGCLFSTPCFNLASDQLEKFADNFKFFTKAYAAVLHRRWFDDKKCPGPRVLALVLTDGIFGDNRKLSTVVLETDDTRLKPFLSNIQLEIINLILQGVPLSEALRELMDQVGYALRDYHLTGGVPRKHTIPLWAFQLTTISVTLVIVAMIIEWCIVRRKLLSNRSHSGIPTAAGRSKTHLIF